MTVFPETHYNGISWVARCGGEAVRTLLIFGVLFATLHGCTAAPDESSATPSLDANPPTNHAAETAVVLFRSYSLSLGPDTKMGAYRPPLDRLVDKGFLVGGQDIQQQRVVVEKRLTLQAVSIQYTDSASLESGGSAAFQFNFGRSIRAVVDELTRARGGTPVARFTFHYGDREVYQRRLPFREGDALFFAGRLDLALPFLSMFTLEIRFFTPDEEKERAEFLGQARRDREALAPPAREQREQEPYLPGIGGVTMPELISREAAVYPEAAKPERLAGEVIVEVVVDREGRTTDPKILTSTDPLFEASALEAARTHVFKPATKDGKPVSVTMTLIIVYRYSASDLG